MLELMYAHTVQTLCRFWPAGKKIAGIRYWQDAGYTVFIHGEEKIRFTAEFFGFTGGTADISAVMPVAVTGIEKMADVFCICAVVCIHIHHPCYKQAAMKAACREFFIYKLLFGIFTLFPVKDTKAAGNGKCRHS